MIFFDPKKVNIYAQVQRNTDAIKALEEAGFIVNLRGKYDASETYEYRDAVTDGGKLYYHYSKTATTGTPTSNATYWELFLDAGVASDINRIEQLTVNTVTKSGNNFIISGTGTIHHEDGTEETGVELETVVPIQGADVSEDNKAIVTSGKKIYAHHITLSASGGGANSASVSFDFYCDKAEAFETSAELALYIENNLGSFTTPCSGYVGNGTSVYIATRIFSDSGTTNVMGYRPDANSRDEVVRTINSIPLYMDSCYEL